MKTMKFLVPAVALAFLMACGNQTAGERTSTNRAVLSQAEQAALTPDCVIEILKQGNQDFVNGNLLVRNSPDIIRDAANGQFPMAVILSCLDSRVPVEDVFNRYIGDLFVGRVAGNLVNVDFLGSMEFATAVAGARVIMVLGHGACGAVMHAINGSDPTQNLVEMLAKIKPAMTMGSAAEYSGDRSMNNMEFVDMVAVQNVILGVQNIRNGSPLLAEMERNGQIRIIGGFYHMETGKVEFFTNL